MARTEALIPEKHIKTFLSVMKLYADMIGDGNMNFNEGGITMGGMDQSHVCLLRTSLPSGMFLSAGGGYTYGGEDVTVGVPFRVVAKIVSAFSNPRDISIGVESGHDSMILVIRTDDGTSRFVVKMMDLDEDGLEIPDMEYDITANVPFKTLQKAFGQAETLEASSVNFAWIPGSSENEMRLRYKTDAVDADVVIHTTPSGHHEGLEVSLSATYPKRLFAAGQMSANVRVAFSRDIPVLFRCDHDSGFTEMYVAPRIDDDGEDDDEDYQNYRE
jgi:proliferating cell nuclear antigen PCNA